MLSRNVGKGKISISGWWGTVSCKAVGRRFGGSSKNDNLDAALWNGELISKCMSSGFTPKSNVILVRARMRLKCRSVSSLWSGDTVSFGCEVKAE